MMRSLIIICTLTTLTFSALPVHAATNVEEAQLARLKQLRSSIASEIQLSAYNLLDEMVYSWTQTPIFSTPTPVVLAGISVPVGLGTGLQALLENHLSALLLQNPATQITLTHCPSCTALVVHSSAKGTVVSRGIDNPQTLEKFGASNPKHGLFIDIEAEGSWLVLRSRITQLTPDLPIVWARTLSSSASTPALLRQPTNLKSVANAREEYLDALSSRGPIVIPARFALRTYKQGDFVIAPPLAWFQTGVEFSPTQAREWTASLLMGYAWLPDAYHGFMAQTRLSRLISGVSRSLTGPDLYLFFGGSLITASGPAVSPFRNEMLTPDQIIADANADEDSRVTFGAWHIGLELRISNRMGVSLFFETIPSLEDSNNLGDYLDLGFIEFESVGTEVTFCF